MLSQSCLINLPVKLISFLRFPAMTRYDLVIHFLDFFQSFFNPFVFNAHFLYPLKTSENRKVLQEVEKGCIGNKWVNKFLRGYWPCSVSFSKFIQVSEVNLIKEINSLR